MLSIFLLKFFKHYLPNVVNPFNELTHVVLLLFYHNSLVITTRLRQYVLLHSHFQFLMFSHFFHFFKY